jgi:hypothetical protein
VVKQDQNFHLNLNKSRSGQALVEYVLLLVVIVGMILAAAKIFKTLNSGMQSYIGDYFACLMEYGELPTLGVQNADLKKHTSGSGKTCDEKFAPFSIADGRPPTGGTTGTTGTGTGTNPSQSVSSKKGDPNGTGTTGSTNSTNGSDGSGSDDTTGASDLAKRGRNGSGTSPYKSGQVVVRGSTYGTADGLDSSDSKTRVLDDEDDELGKNARERKARRRPRKRRIGEYDSYRAVSGRALQEIEKSIKGRAIARKPTSTVLKVDAEAGRVGPHKKTITPPEEIITAQKDTKNDGFSLSGLFRWLLIAGMIVAIVVFFGGQLLNYSNSDS